MTLYVNNLSGAKLITFAKNPIICLGGGAHGAAEALSVLADMLKCPVSALRQGKGAYDEGKPLAVMGPVAHELWKTVDVAIGIGTRFMWHEMSWGVDDDLKLIQILETDYKNCELILND